MDQAPQFAAQISPWLTPVVLLTVLGLMWRSMLRLEDRLGKRIDDTNKRIDDTNRRIDDTAAALVKRIDDTGAALGARIDDTNRRIDDTAAALVKRIDDTAAALGARIDDTTAALGARIDGIDNRLRALETGQAEIKGKLDFVEAYILGRNAPGTAPAE